MKASLESQLSSEIQSAIRGVFGGGPIPLHSPNFCGSEWNYLKECLDSTLIPTGSCVHILAVQVACAAVMVSIPMLLTT